MGNCCSRKNCSSRKTLNFPKKVVRKWFSVARSRSPSFRGSRKLRKLPRELSWRKRRKLLSPRISQRISQRIFRRISQPRRSRKKRTKRKKRRKKPRNKWRCHRRRRSKNKNTTSNQQIPL